MKRIYLDNAAASPIAPEAIEAFNHACDQFFANTSSVHATAQRAEFALQNARERLTNILNARSATVVFTATGTEADNLAVIGTALAARKKFGYNHVAFSAVEHPAVENSAKLLHREFGFEISRVAVNAYGIPTTEAIAECVKSNTALCSFILANNEVGTISPISQLSAQCKKINPQILVHADAVQAAAWLQIDFNALGADLITIGGHKFGSPGGGALIMRKGTPLHPVIVGGNHEGGMRAGTPNVPEVMAMVRALEIRREQIAADIQHDSTHRVANLRDLIIATVLKEISGTRLTGHPAERLPNHASFVFENLEGNTLARMLDFKGYAVSPGAACKTGNPVPSAVLQALGFSDALALGGLRVSIGFETLSEDVNAFLTALPEAVERARG